jgi:hypothetical protein
MAALPMSEATVRRLMARPPSSPASASLWVYDREPSEGGRSTLRTVRDQSQPLRPTPGLLTDAEIVRALRRFRFDDEFRGARRAPIRALAELVGLIHQTVYLAMRPDLPRRPGKMQGGKFASNLIAGWRRERGWNPTFSRDP